LDVYSLVSIAFLSFGLIYIIQFSTAKHCENNIMRRMVVSMNWNSILFLHQYFIVIYIAPLYISWIFISILRCLYTKTGRNSIAVQDGVTYSYRVNCRAQVL